MTYLLKFECWLDDSWDVVARPYTAFRVIHFKKADVTVDGSVDLFFTCDSNLDDPAIDDILIVHADAGLGVWICEYKGQMLAVSGVVKGFKGNAHLDAGYFFAPYVPLTQTPVVLDPNSFKKTRGILTRYGKKLLAQGKQYYGTTTVK